MENIISYLCGFCLSATAGPPMQCKYAGKPGKYVCLFFIFKTSAVQPT